MAPPLQHAQQAGALSGGAGAADAERRVELRPRALRATLRMWHWLAALATGGGGGDQRLRSCDPKADEHWVDLLTLTAPGGCHACGACDEVTRWIHSLDVEVIRQCDLDKPSVGYKLLNSD